MSPNAIFMARPQSYARRCPTSSALKTGFRGRDSGRGPARWICRVGRRDPPEAPIGRIGFRLAFARGSRRPEANPDSARIVPVKRDDRPRRPNGRPLSARGREDCEERTPLWARALVAPFPRERSAVRKSTSWPAPGVRAQRRRLPQGRLSLGEREETSTRFAIQGSDLPSLPHGQISAVTALTAQDREK
jgi:hypothetical protein